MQETPIRRSRGTASTQIVANDKYSQLNVGAQLMDMGEKQAAAIAPAIIIIEQKGAAC